ncbi:similar to Saccharomyces cerevisiae YNR013C PHO91 Low-affinity phosphate transporter of the vacuolar membrane [Maudiozyma barnettii]|uniref:Similar to Saccharomyces cerevisiae YNR013C PHO91 Low-affinity phosphate transporter of the vacuolar membrane n=1 Tax=Maudiozyma barnettii TaxID=61262 RepID=A0A8H2VH58_9SACH|nr:Pho91p [Kazachstania barnettii]CAB4255402.1 similar to Saccharomyces cerevisiae YNR013C PHO91 Low-affinity phosphate transporter of the vacuolar membrane [Kazachstania barnettii]CAD1783808.1 similar to Saccharomyces cerevisiae YNR013C PHO91 Low-affinity phosphate transporter of the vacuolar membrane [Kazachstania barnettii]
MKFSHSLQFNAVPEWSSKYIAYSHLKKLIYSLQKEKLYAKGNSFQNLNDTEQTPLLEENSDPYVLRFIQQLNIELKKIDKFYISQETGVLANYNELDDDVNEFKSNLLNNRLPSLSDAVPQSKSSSNNNKNGKNSNMKLNRRKRRSTGRKNSMPDLPHIARIATTTSELQGIVSTGNGPFTDIDTNIADEDEYYDDDDDDDESMNSGLAMSIESAPAIRANNDLDMVDDVDIHSNHIIATQKSRNSLNTWGSLSQSRDNNGPNYLITPFLQHKVTLKKRLVAMFTQLSELKEYIELNQTGFSKICKKFDKSLNTKIKNDYLKTIVTKSHVFKPETIANIKSLLNDTIIIYAKLSKETYPSIPSFAELSNNNSDLYLNVDEIENDQDTHVSREDLVDYEAAEKELSSHLRDHVVWERNTVWKDLMNLERKSQNVKTTHVNNIRTRNNSLVGSVGAQPSVIEFDTAGNYLNVETIADFSKLSIKQMLFLVLNATALWKFVFITAIFLSFVGIYSPFEDTLQRNCFAILIYASLLWATETLPLFVTSLLIPLLIVVFPVLKDQSSMEPLTSVQASQFILSTMWSSVIMLLLGGFTLAAALSKYNIAKVLSTYILSSAGTNPQVILITNMFVAAFVSMWVSNVAAPVLCYSIIQPLLRTLPRNCDYSKSLILGIALASNIGGMSSPISSPQNIFSFGLMSPPPSWIEWFIISIPVCIISILLIWVLLVLTFNTDSKDIKILQFHPLRDPFTITQWFVSITSIGTILLWCLSNKLSEKFGDMGIISIIPIALLFGTGLLSSDDFNNFMWTIVILAMGGTTLGKAVSNCGLLSTIAHIIKESVEGQPLFLIVLLFGLGVLVMATFVSHTVAAMILVPLMGEIGANLPGEDHSRLLIMITTLLCSCAMGLPTSGLPNVTAISMIDEVGDRYLTVGNFITRGVPASLIAYVLVVTVGYSVLRLLDF